MVLTRLVKHQYCPNTELQMSPTSFSSFFLCLGDSFLSEGCVSVRTACDADSEASSALMLFPFLLLLLQKQAKDRNDAHLLLAFHVRHQVA